MVFYKEIGVLKSPSFKICTRTSCFTNLNSGPVFIKINGQVAIRVAVPDQTLPVVFTLRVQLTPPDLLLDNTVQHMYIYVQSSKTYMHVYKYLCIYIYVNI
jgi:hypothetical protein